MGGFGTFHNLRIHPEVYCAGFAVVAGVNLNQWQNNFDILPNAATYKTKDVKIRFYNTSNDFFKANNLSLDSAFTKASLHNQSGSRLHSSIGQRSVGNAPTLSIDGKVCLHTVKPPMCIEILKTADK